MDSQAQTAADDVNSVDGRSTTREETTDEQLPITSERNVKWWDSAIHSVAAMVGNGVLSLPYAMSQLGWIPGIVVLMLFWIFTSYTLWQMVEMHEMVPGKRFDTYQELNQYAFGEELGLCIVLIQQVISGVSTNIVYMVTGGKSLQKLYNTLCYKDCKSIKLTYFIMIFASVQFVLSHIPKFIPNFIATIWGSLVGGFMALSYSIVVWSVSVYLGVQPDVDYDYKAKPTVGKILNFFSALGNVAFAYTGHNSMMELQAGIPSTPEKPSKGPMWEGVQVANIVVALCYFPAALVGYWRFGNSVSDNILISLEEPKWLIAIGNLFVFFHVTGRYQIYATPVFDMIETVAVEGRLNFKSTPALRFILRNMYVALTMFIAIFIPFFGGLLAFFGGFSFAPTKYVLPCVTWLRIRKPKRYSMSWFTSWICIFVGVCVMIISSVGGLWQIIQQAKTYEVFS